MDFGDPRALRGSGLPFFLPRGRDTVIWREAVKRMGGSRQVITKEAEATAWVSGTVAEMV
jgi:hypothetical protein